ncbi:MAG: PKD domain-containing protein, partial [Deltaproteobacteria bacterium]|nr:PKD domain-containing protein [Deltaproteobacteria bacterium]
KGTVDSSIYVMQNEPPTLYSVTITGSSQVNESSGAQYILTAIYSDGNSSEVTGFASWRDNSSYASINSNGYLTASSVTSDQPCTITVSYEGQSDTHNVIIENIPPNNSPVVDFTYATSRKKVTFNDRSTDSDGTIVSWLWDFGDGTYNITQNSEHRYTKFRNYSVTLTVTDNEGVSNSISKTVSITK